MGVQLRGTLIELPEGSYVHLRTAAGRAQKHGQGRKNEYIISQHLSVFYFIQVLPSFTSIDVADPKVLFICEVKFSDVRVGFVS